MWLTKPIALQVVSRVGQGAADAVIYIVGMTIILDTVTIKRIAEYMGYVTWAMNVGTFAGPLLGGVVFNRAGYHATWWMMLGFVLLDVFLRVLMVEKSRSLVEATSFESTVAVLEQERPGSIGGQDAPVPSKSDLGQDYALNEVQVPVDDTAIQSLPTGNTALAEKLPALLTLTMSMRMAVALYGTCVQSMVFSGFETVLSLYVQELWGYDSLGAGLIFIPLTLPSFFAPLLGRLIDRTNPRWALIVGFLGLSAVLVACQNVKQNTMSQKVLMCALLFLVGTFITVALNPLMAEISYVADDEAKTRKSQRRRMSSSGGAVYAQAYSLFGMAWAAGNIAGPLMCGLIKDEAGWGIMCWSLGILNGTTAVPCFIWSGKGLRAWPFSSRGQ